MDTRMTALLLAAALTGPAAGEGIDFSVDWAAFRGGGDSSRVEFFYAIPIFSGPRLQLDFQEKDSGLVAEFAVRFEMSGDNGYEQDAMLYKRATIASYSEAREAQRSFVDGFSLNVPPGNYDIGFTVSQPKVVQAGDSDTVEFVEKGSREAEMTVDDFSAGPAMSDLQLAAGVVYDTITGGFTVVPNPTRRYGVQGVDRVYFYFEGYGLSPEADSYEVSTTVLGTGAEPETLVSGTPQVKPKSGTDVSSALGVSVASLDPGEYRLEVGLRDRHGGATIRRTASFTVGEEPGPVDATPWVLQLSELEQKYYDRLEYIATPRELDYFNALSDSGREAYLAWYWSKHNLPEFTRRMETAKERYRSSTTSGLKTDRGRMYIKYGEPEEVSRKVLEVEVRPREYWHYYNQGYTFIFIDITGTDDYRLAWTNSPHEPPSAYEHLLTPEEEDLYR